MMKREVSLKIDSMSFGAAAIGTDAESGIKVFVENACPGDKIQAEIYDEQKDMAFAQLTELIIESPLREKEPLCKLHKICGSCQWQHIKYTEQLNFKKKNLRDAFKQNNISEDLVFNELEVRGLSNPWYFRNKVIYPVETVKSTGRLLAGYYKTKTNDLINIKHCPIQYEIFDQIMERLKDLCSEAQIGTPLLRHILLRGNFDRSEVLVSFILRKKLLRNSEKVLIKNIFEKIKQEFSVIKLATINYNDDSTNVILGEMTELIVGDRDYILDKLSIPDLERNAEVKVKISTASFFQINNEQFCNILVSIKGFLNDAFAEWQSNILQKRDYRVLDAYSGIGSISLALAESFPHLSFRSFEINTSSVKNAQENIELNKLANLSVELASAEEYFVKPKNLEFDLIILNPPRKGCSRKILENILKSEAKSIIYLSCNPTTLARDIKILETQGFKLKAIKAFDMFPHTFHLETLVYLVQKKTS